MVTEKKILRDCYLWRYRNKDQTFSKFGPLDIEEYYDTIDECIQHHLLDSGFDRNHWEYCTKIPKKLDNVEVTCNHYYYMISENDYDIHKITYKFFKFVEYNYEKLCNEYECKAFRAKDESRKKILEDKMRFYEKCLDNCRERLDGKYYYDYEQ